MHSHWPAPGSCSSNALPSPRRQSLKGCIAALPHMFQWSRMLGSNNKCIATMADVQTRSVATEKQTNISKGSAKQVKPVVLQREQRHQEDLEQAAAVSNVATTRSSNVSQKVSNTGMSRGMDQTAGSLDLRQVLHAKQEPFVLQDVIHEKRHPIRTQSSRELKFEVPSTRRSSKMKKTKNNTTKDHEEAAVVGDSAVCESQNCVPPKQSTGSATVLSRNKVPVETMVAIPSHQHSGSKKAHSKMASKGRNSVKNPNKRALLMEAAARILEGSNHLTPKRPSTSVRSLLEDFERPKHGKKLSKPKKTLVRAVVLNESESSEREEDAETAAESEKHQKSYDLKLLGMHNSNNSCNQRSETLQILEKAQLVMQSRLFSNKNALDDAEVLPSLATPFQNPRTEMKSVQMHGDLWSGMIGDQEETVNQIVRGFKLDSSEELPQATTGVLPEVIIAEKLHTEADHNPLSNDSRAIVRSPSIDIPAAGFSPIMLSTCLHSNFDSGMPSLVGIILDPFVSRYFTRGYQAAGSFSANNPERNERSGTSLIEGADERGYNYKVRDMRTDLEWMEEERQSSDMQLRLCNYSWWANSHQNGDQNQFSTEYCDGYDSPVAARSPCSVRVWIADCEDSCICVDEIQQASPVSVLDPVYEEELEPGSYSFDNFEEARQKLLEKVRRYEMLAHMGVDNMVEEDMHVSHGNGWWENDDGCSSSCSSSSSSAAPTFQPFPAHVLHFSNSDVAEAQQSRKRFKVEPYVEEEILLYEQEEYLATWPPATSLDCGLSPNSCRGNQAPSRRLEEVAEPTISVPVDHVVLNSLLHNDLARTNWSSFCKQEEEVVEVELENCFFDVLICELLSDLLEGFCNACHPVHV